MSDSSSSSSVTEASRERDRTFSIRVLTPEGTEFSGEVKAVSATAALGKLSILYQHAPFITALAEGDLTLTSKESAEGKTIPLRSGLMMVKGNNVTILKSA